MAFDKKTSMYSNRGTIGSAEELDAYGVWVKSEPQDMAAGFAGTMDFGAAGFGGDGLDASSFGNDFDSGYGDYDMPDVDISGLTGASDVDIGEFKISSFDDEITAETAQSVPEDKSTQLLVKIADELSSIRSELSTLKNEFADIRRGPGREEAKQDEFFTVEDENLSADSELENLNAAFSSETAFDPLRDEDEAALRKLSEEKGEGDTGGDGAAVPEDIEIDFDNLGINLDGVVSAGGGETDDDSFFDDFHLPTIETAVDFGLSELPDNYNIDDPLDELDELRDLRLEGAAPMTTAPENNAYLEEDPFSLNDDAPENASENVSVDGVNLEANLDINNFDINLDDFTIETPALLEELETTLSFDDIPRFDDAPISEDSALNLDLSGVVTDETDLSDVTSMEEDEPVQAEAEDPNIARDIPEAFEENTDEIIDDTTLSLDEELELPEPALTAEGLETEVEAEALAETVETLDDIIAVEQPVEKVKAGSGISANMKTDLKGVLSYMDGLLESLPEEKIEEFAKSEYFDTYRKLFKELGLV